MSMTDTREENMIILEKLPYIHNPVQFWKRDKEVIKALVHSSSEINKITLAYVK